VWYDKAYESELNKRAMLDGVRASRCYLLVLTWDVLKSPAVQSELRAAIEAKKPIALLHESDNSKPGWRPFSHYIETVPAFCPQLFDGHQSLAYQRDYYLLAGFYDKLVARIESRG
jgi:hypothetical protein